MRTTDEVSLLMWTNGASRPDLGLPGLLVLQTLAWTIGAINDRFGNSLIGRCSATSTFAQREDR